MGTSQDARLAIRSYRAAAEHGNFLGLAYLAKLLSRTRHVERAEVLWDRFFERRAEDPHPTFLAAAPGELMHDYIKGQLRYWLDPAHLDVLRARRREVAAHHQQVLEHALEAQLLPLKAVGKWISVNLGPWR